MEDSSEVSSTAKETSVIPEFIRKSDLDIATFDSLKTYATNSTISYLISGGYAVEAHTGGKITRPHGDMDMYFFSGQGFDSGKIATNVTSLLQNESTQWKLHETSQTKIEFREDAPAKKFPDRRRLEIMLFTHTPHITNKALIDSQGISHELAVEELNSLVSSKINILFRKQRSSTIERPIEHEKQGLRRLFSLKVATLFQKGNLPAGRPTAEQDKNELRRLISLPELNKSIVMNHTADYFRYKGMAPEQALQEAERAWTFAKEFIK